MKIQEQWWPLASYWSDDLPKGTLMLVDKIVRNEAHSGGFAVRVLGTNKKRYARARYYSIGWFVPSKAKKLKYPPFDKNRKETK